MGIFIDEATGKATEVHFGIYTVQLDWQGLMKEDSVIDGRAYHQEVPMSGQWYLGMDNISSKEEGFRSVTGGDRIRTMSGGGKQVLEHPMQVKAKSRTTITCRWSINRNKKEKTKSP